MAEVLTTNQFAQLAGVSVDTAQRWLDSYQLGYRLPTGARRIERAAAQAFVDGMHRRREPEVVHA